VQHRVILFFLEGFHPIPPPGGRFRCNIETRGKRLSSHS
jgi:hypothetical protein